MFCCLVRLSTGALSGGLYANPLEMAIQSAVACSEAQDDGLLVSWQLMECVLIWVASCSLEFQSRLTMASSGSERPILALPPLRSLAQVALETLLMLILIMTVKGAIPDCLQSSHCELSPTRRLK